MKKVFLLVLGLVFIAGAIYFYLAADKAKHEVDKISSLTIKKPSNAPKEKIWIGADTCKTTFGANTIAFCNGESKDDSLFLDSGADAAVKKCFEYTADKLGRPLSAIRDIACEVKKAYENLQFEYDDEKDTPGIKNNNYNILNHWVNQ